MDDDYVEIDFHPAIVSVICDPDDIQDIPEARPLIGFGL